ncbi:MMPL family transporter [Streptomyces sp. NPDC090022]|uniref:MMPL family transporter n=1 Tax=Streptomyces sp. NPDC090022 TaxID=3365920 RepID=UPI003802111D
MATFLYRLGKGSFRRRRLVALLWVALLALAGFGAATAAAPSSGSFSIPGTEAQRAFDMLDERFPGQSADGATARIVIKAPAGGSVNDPGVKSQVEKIVTGLKDGPGKEQIASVTDPYQAQAISHDGSIAYVTATYKVSGMELTDASRDALTNVGKDLGAGAPQVEIGGDALMEAPKTGSSEIIGIVVAAIVLVITFGSLVAAGLPLLTALIGVGIGVSSITALASVLDLGTTTSILAMMIGLAVGIDYALFIVSRYRAELAEGLERDEAAGRAAGTAGSAVVFAGLTVVIALVGLAVVNIPMLTKMGVAAAGTVVIAVLVALTLVPAILGFAGRKVLPAGTKSKLFGGGKDKPADRAAKPNGGTRWARFVLRRPVLVLLAGVIGLGAVAIPAGKLEMGLPDDGAKPVSSSQRKAYDLLSDGFGPGFNGPLLVVVDGDKALADRTFDRLTKLDGVAKGPDGNPVVMPPRFNEAGDAAIITVIPADRPSSAATEELVHEIRDGSDKHVMVTGTTAINIDFSQKMNDALLPYLALVVGLAFLLLMLVFRSVLVPLKAALGFLLSVVAALGAVVAVYQWGWLGSLFGVDQPGPIMSMMPIFMVGVVFGLAMDYEVFLVTRMREAYVHGERPGQAIVTGFRYSARVVTAAAVIMIAVFAGFIGMDDQMVKMIGFGLAIAVLFDAFVVRMAIVPAVLALLGHKAWWLPKWLDRLLPNVDVEGEGLRKHLKDAEDAEDADGARGADPDKDADGDREKVLA